jgi:hypothetical protein
LGNAEWPYLAMARMEDRQGENLVRVAGKVCRHSSSVKKLKKHLNIETPYKYTMQ